MRYELAVIGLGYVGLPLACEATASGLRVLGIDTDPEVVESLASGSSHIDDLTDADVALALERGVKVTDDPSSLAECRAVAICVPTPLANNAPDLKKVTSAAETIAMTLGRDQLVVLESTSYPGTTEEVVLPILEKGSGLTAGTDFFLVYSPERIDPANPHWGLRNTPKLVAGINPESAARAEELYGKICDEVVVLSGTREAEMAKLLENTYRHVNIALVNEMAIFCDELGIDIWEAIRGASTKPFGYQPFYPGPGVGGHCIPIDPSYLSYRVKELGYPFRFVELAQEINARMPVYVANRASRLLNDQGRSVKGSRILLLGVAYKPDVSDTRETPAIVVARRLLSLGAEVRFCDPHVKELMVDGEHLPRCDDAVSSAGDADLTIILTPHSSFDLTEISAAARLVLDTRGVAPKGNGETL